MSTETEDRMKRSLSRLPLAGMLLVTSIADAAAQSSGGTLQPVQSTLTQLVSALTGPIATALATLAVIACGFFAWSGRLTWGIAGSVIFGIVLVFGSAQIVQFFQSAVGQ
jgi:type IV secretion system protein VirB2